jgi:hypothetical protein
MASTWRIERGRPKAGPFRAKPCGHGALDPCDMMHSTFDTAVAPGHSPARSVLCSEGPATRGRAAAAGATTLAHEPV